MEIVVSLTSVLIALIVAIYTYKNNAIQNKKMLVAFTLQYIEMENADKELQQARIWLEEVVVLPNIDVKLYSNRKMFFENFGVEIEIEENKFSFNLEDMEVWIKYRTGAGHIHKILEARQVASEALRRGMLDESTYRLIRCGDFMKDFIRLKSFIEGIDKYRENNKKNSPKFLEDFRYIIQRWKDIQIPEEIILK